MVAHFRPKPRLETLALREENPLGACNMIGPTAAKEELRDWALYISLSEPEHRRRKLGQWKKTLQLKVSSLNPNCGDGRRLSYTRTRKEPAVSNSGKIGLSIFQEHRLLSSIAIKALF